MAEAGHVIRGDVRAFDERICDLPGHIKSFAVSAVRSITFGGGSSDTSVGFGLEYPVGFWSTVSGNFSLGVNGTCGHVPCEVVPVSVNRCFQTINA